MKPETRDRLTAAIRSAAARPTRPLPTHTGPRPGDTYVFPSPGDLAVEWLVVRAHPDDPQTLLVAPLDTFPLAGPADVALDEVWVVRCGESEWLPATLFADERRTGSLAPGSLAQARRTLHQLALGVVDLDRDRIAAANDPEYNDWMRSVSLHRAALSGLARLLESE